MLAVAIYSAAMLAVAQTGGTAAPARCHTKELTVTLRQGSPAAGQRYATVFLQNRSSRRCALRGYLRAQLYRGDRRVPTRIVRVRPHRRETVILRRGEKAWTRWHWTVAPGPSEPTDDDCEPTAKRIVITPPDATRPVRRRWRMGPVCGHGRIDEGPVRGAGADVTRR